MERWDVADAKKEELIKAVMADIVTPIIACQPTVKPEQKWIPVTPETLPNNNSVVVARVKTGTWDYGQYRGHGNDIHYWNWKKNTYKHVYWWMYKSDALPEPYQEEGEK